jgi:Family of unknown function (DUF5670)
MAGGNARSSGRGGDSERPESCIGGLPAEETNMLETLIVLLVLLWAFGYWGPYHAHLGPLVHVLILVAVVVLVIRLIQGRRVL